MKIKLSSSIIRSRRYRRNKPTYRGIVASVEEKLKAGGITKFYKCPILLHEPIELGDEVILMDVNRINVLKAIKKLAKEKAR